MSDDLIKRDDALAAIDTFKRNFEQPWKVQFSADIRALPAVDLSERIEQLEAKLAEAEAVAKIWQEDFIQENNRWGDALLKLDKAVEALREIKSITVHSGGDINGVKASAWRDAFEQAHCEACAALAELEEK